MYEAAAEQYRLDEEGFVEKLREIFKVNTGLANIDIEGYRYEEVTARNRRAAALRTGEGSLSLKERAWAVALAHEIDFRELPGLMIRQESAGTMSSPAAAGLAGRIREALGGTPESSTPASMAEQAERALHRAQD